MFKQTHASFEPEKYNTAEMFRIVFNQFKNSIVLNWGDPYIGDYIWTNMLHQMIEQIMRHNYRSKRSIDIPDDRRYFLRAPVCDVGTMGAILENHLHSHHKHVIFIGQGTGIQLENMSNLGLFGLTDGPFDRNTHLKFHTINTSNQELCRTRAAIQAIHSLSKMLSEQRLRHYFKQIMNKVVGATIFGSLGGMVECMKTCISLFIPPDEKRKMHSMTDTQEIMDFAQSMYTDRSKSVLFDPSREPFIMFVNNFNWSLERTLSFLRAYSSIIDMWIEGLEKAVSGTNVSHIKIRDERIGNLLRCKVILQRDVSEYLDEPTKIVEPHTPDPTLAKYFERKNLRNIRRHGEKLNLLRAVHSWFTRAGERNMTELTTRLRLFAFETHESLYQTNGFFVGAYTYDSRNITESPQSSITPIVERTPSTVRIGRVRRRSDVSLTPPEETPKRQRRTSPQTPIERESSQMVLESPLYHRSSVDTMTLKSATPSSTQADKIILGSTLSVQTPGQALRISELAKTVPLPLSPATPIVPSLASGSVVSEEERVLTIDSISPISNKTDSILSSDNEIELDPYGVFGFNELRSIIDFPSDSTGKSYADLSLNIYEGTISLGDILTHAISLLPPQYSVPTLLVPFPIVHFPSRGEIGKEFYRGLANDDTFPHPTQGRRVPTVIYATPIGETKRPESEFHNVEVESDEPDNTLGFLYPSEFAQQINIIINSFAPNVDTEDRLSRFIRYADSFSKERKWKLVEMIELLHKMFFMTDTTRFVDINIEEISPAQELDPRPLIVPVSYKFGEPRPSLSRALTMTSTLSSLSGTPSSSRTSLSTRTSPQNTVWTTPDGSYKTSDELAMSVASDESATERISPDSGRVSLDMAMDVVESSGSDISRGAISPYNTSNSSIVVALNHIIQVPSPPSPDERRTSRSETSSTREKIDNLSLVYSLSPTSSDVTSSPSEMSIVYQTPLGALSQEQKSTQHLDVEEMIAGRQADEIQKIIGIEESTKEDDKMDISPPDARVLPNSLAQFVSPVPINPSDESVKKSDEAERAGDPAQCYTYYIHY